MWPRDLVEQTWIGRDYRLLVLSHILQGLSASVVYATRLAMVIDTVAIERLGRTIGTVCIIFRLTSGGPIKLITMTRRFIPSLRSVSLERLSSVGFWYERASDIGLFGASAGLLAVDLVMKMLVVIEKKVAAAYCASAQAGPPAPLPDVDASQEDAEQQTREPDATEATLLVGGTSQHQEGVIFRILPDRCLLTAVLTFVQPTIVGTYDATIPTEASSLFSFSSLSAGFLFIPLGLSNLLFAPLAGWVVDAHGTKATGVAGFAFYSLYLALLRLPAQRPRPFQGRHQNTVLYCCVLALNGVGMSMITSPSIVKASNIVDAHARTYPRIFGDKEPYGKLYGFSGLVLNVGLTFVPVLGGLLRERIGYGNTNAVVAGIAAAASLLALFIFNKGKGVTPGSRVQQPSTPYG